MRSDDASGVSFHAGPSGTAGAPFIDAMAWAVSPSGVFSLPSAPLGVSSGGTGANTPAAARAALGAAAASTPAITGAPVVTVGPDLVGQRFITGAYGVAHYYDGGSYYFLVTPGGQQTATSYSGIRPFHVNLATGLVGMENGLSIAGGLAADSLTLSGPFNVAAQGASKSRALSSHLADQVSLLDFGAVGDGKTDDTAAIQAALNAVANGISVLAPPLTFKVSSTLTVGNGGASTKWGRDVAGALARAVPRRVLRGLPEHRRGPPGLGGRAGRHDGQDRRPAQLLGAVQPLPRRGGYRGRRSASTW